MVEAVNSGKRLEIAKKAQELAVAYKSSIYDKDGTHKTTSCMDCSYFVYLVLKEIFQDYVYINTNGIVQSSKFRPSSNAKVGDVIFFEAGKVPHEVSKGHGKEFPNHVGIVIDNSNWVGRQTSKLGIVSFNDIWWWPRGPKFYSYSGLDEAFVAHSAAEIRKSMA